MVRDPNLVSRLLHAVPARVPTHVVALAVNHVLRGQPLTERHVRVAFTATDERIAAAVERLGALAG